MNEHSAHHLRVCVKPQYHAKHLVAQAFDQHNHPVGREVAVVIRSDVEHVAAKHHIQPDRVHFEGEAERIIDENTEGSAG